MCNYSLQCAQVEREQRRVAISSAPLHTSVGDNSPLSRATLEHKGEAAAEVGGEQRTHALQRTAAVTLTVTLTFFSFVSSFVSSFSLLCISCCCVVHVESYSSHSSACVRTTDTATIEFDIRRCRSFTALTTDATQHTTENYDIHIACRTSNSSIRSARHNTTHTHESNSRDIQQTKVRRDEGNLV